jgi:hypothetical protein
MNRFFKIKRVRVLFVTDLPVPVDVLYCEGKFYRISFSQTRTSRGERARFFTFARKIRFFQEIVLTSLKSMQSNLFDQPQRI